MKTKRNTSGTFYKIRNKTTGLFWTSKGWKQGGKSYANVGSVKNGIIDALKPLGKIIEGVGPPKKSGLVNYEVVIYETREKGILDLDKTPRSRGAKYTHA